MTFVMTLYACPFIFVNIINSRLLVDWSINNITAAAVGLGVIFGSADGAEVFFTLGTPLQFGVDRWSTPFEI